MPGDSVLCTNPAALPGGSALVDPISPSAPFDPQSTLAVGIKLLGLTTADAEHGVVRGTRLLPGGVLVGRWRQRAARSRRRTERQTAKPSPTPEWGLHLLDANVALGNLIAIVKAEAAAFAKSGR